MIKITKKMPNIPFPIIGRVCKKASIFIVTILPVFHQPISAIINPPAITEAICPETFAPAACIRRKF